MAETSTKIPKGYKQTEVGLIPEDWELRPLLKSVSIASGQVNPRIEPYKSMVLVAPDHIESRTGRLIARKTASEQGAISGKYLFKPRDIIYSKIRPYLRKVIIADFPGLCSADMYPLTSERNVSPEFVFAVLLSENFSRFAENVSVRSGIPKLNREELSEYNISLPRLPEQCAIAAILSDTDTLIRNLENLIAKKRAIKMGAMQELLTGKRRLPGFSGEWEKKGFEEIFRRINVKDNKLKTINYLKNGKFPVVDQGKDLVIGYTDRDDKCFRCPKGGVIVFGDHTCIVKYIDFDFVVGADGTQVLNTNEKHYTRFFAYQLEYCGIKPTGYNRHFKLLKERKFLSPTKNEQTAIATVLSDIDAEIEKLEGKLAKYKFIKTGMMQQLLTGKIRVYEKSK